MGLFKGEKLVSHWRLATDHERMPDEYGLQMLTLLQRSHSPLKKLTGICLASVVPPLTGRILQACTEYLQMDPLVVTSDLNIGIKILYEEPSAVGADRIADAVATHRLYGGPACIIDFGTATTFNALDENGNYLGGAITAGIGIAIEALFQRTARLPRIELKTPPSVIGRNTTHAMQSGLIFGFVSLTEGMVLRFRNILGDKMKVIATGGLAEIVSSQTKMIEVTAPWLTLDGLRMIWEMNR
jgi:type III pantothenate kinase